MHAFTRHDADGKPLECILLDMSVCRYASPCTDLAYFLHSSVAPLLRETHAERILARYHDALVRCLGDLGEDPASYPWRDLVRDYDRHSFCGFSFAWRMLPFLLAPKDDSVGQDAFKGDLSDPAVMKAIMDRNRAKMVSWVEREPQIKVMLAGSIVDMIRRGIFKHP